MQDDLDRMSSAQLQDLKRKVERRLRHLEGKDSRSLAEKLGGNEKVELVAFGVKQMGIRCRALHGGEPVTLRPGAGIRSEAEAHILTVQPNKAWTYRRTTYLSGRVIEMRLDIPALGLVPLKLKDETLWDPKEEHWGEEGEPIMDCFKPIIAAGLRPSFEMDQILPGFDCDDPDSDPIGRAVDFQESGDVDWNGAGLTTGHLCVAFTAWVSAAGPSAILRRRKTFLNGCSGSIQAITKEPVSAYPR